MHDFKAKASEDMRQEATKDALSTLREVVEGGAEDHLSSARKEGNEDDFEESDDF
jgi:hypothetical protein